jgi:hypothetical protein
MVYIVMKVDFMKEITISNGRVKLVDDEDYETAIKYKWTVSHKGKNSYQVCTNSMVEGIPYRGVSYKRLILGMEAKWTLFKNGNPLDLRRENITVFNTASEFISVISKKPKKKGNELNTAISKAAQGKTGSTKKTRYIGVRYEPKNPHKWIGIIKHNWKNYYLGCFTKEEDAALAYDKKALELYGPDATVNFPHLTMKEINERLDQIREEDAVFSYDILSKRHQGRRFENVSKTSKYIGVSLKKGREKKWRATIFYHNKQYFLGNYYNEKDAALAYDKKAVELYGEDAKLNFPSS